MAVSEALARAYDTRETHMGGASADVLLAVVVVD